MRHTTTTTIDVTIPCFGTVEELEVEFDYTPNFPDWSIDEIIEPLNVIWPGPRNVSGRQSWCSIGTMWPGTFDSEGRTLHDRCVEAAESAMEGAYELECDHAEQWMNPDC